MSMENRLSLPEPKLELLFMAEIAAGEIFDAGITSEGRLKISAGSEGSFTSPELSGKVLSCSGISQTTDSAGMTYTSSKYMLRTEKGGVISIEASGTAGDTASGEAEISYEKLFIKTWDPKFRRLNNTVAIGVVSRISEKKIRLDTYLVN